MKQAIIYIRVSSDEQVRGTSLSTQEAECRDWCSRNGYAVAGIERDEGESAKTADRPGLIAAVARCQRGIDALVVHKLDRLARNATDGLAIRAELKRHGCALASATEAAGDDPVGEMVSTVLLAVAQFDNQVRAVRSKSGMAAVVRAGGWACKAPRGYRMARAGNLPILEIDPQVAPLIRAAITGYADETMSHLQASSMLVEAGFPPSHVDRVWTSPVYGGVIRSPLAGGQEVKAAFAGIVDIGTWRRASDRAATRASRPRERKAEFLATGVATCSVCGRHMRGSYSRGKLGVAYPYYHCPAGCVRLRAEPVHDRVRAMVRDWAGQIKDLRGRVLAQAGTVRDEWRARRDAAAKRRSAAEDRLSRLTDGYSDGTIDRGTYLTKAAEYRRAITAAGIEEKASAATVDHLINGLDLIIDTLADPMSLWLRLDQENRRKLVGRLSEGLILSPRRTPTSINKDGHFAPSADCVARMAPLTARESNPEAEAQEIIGLFGAMRSA